MEAREILQKSWDLSPSYSSHSIYLHLEAAKKAVANQKRADRKEISQWLNVKKVRPLPGLQQNKVKAL